MSDIDTLLAAAQGGSKEALDALEERVGTLSHESDCPRRFHGAAECMCIRSEVLEVLSDDGREV